MSMNSSPEIVLNLISSPLTKGKRVLSKKGVKIGKKWCKQMSKNLKNNKHELFFTEEAWEMLGNVSNIIKGE
jgi:hypothetical protein